MKKTLLAILLTTLLLTGCQGGPSVEEKLEKSKEIMEQEQIEPTEKDTAIIEEVVKDDKVEYAYVTHHEETYPSNTAHLQIKSYL